MNMDEDDTLLKITYQRCNGFVTCKISSGELLYIKFLHAVLSTFVLYPEYILQEIFTFSGLKEQGCNTCIKIF